MRILLPLLAAVAITAAEAPPPAPDATSVAEPGPAASPITSSQAWARATAPRAVAGAVYLAIANGGAQEDRVVSATSPACERVELHRHERSEDGVLRMVAVESLALPPGATVTLQPGGDHLMLIGLKAPLAEGGRVAATLTLASGATLEIDAPVLAVAAMGPAPACCEH